MIRVSRQYYGKETYGMSWSALLLLAQSNHKSYLEEINKWVKRTKMNNIVETKRKQ